ncbi:heavy metal-associated isoprenylated plant protein 6-like [Phragmites australis]|uniref:heavy metal-associated isoprenylated plant protein 6-like n=1 Tax=Phragmites australis TaxID=29695 RepID=UPI002D79CE95|nr:heavy metal-associated isoprenylated plant protein 6-like [Phragmites australis]
MGAGKGGGEEAAAAPGAAQPVVLKMELHCAGCAQKVKKAIKHRPGVESVVADVAANRVVVAGTADAAALKAWIEAKTKKSVEVVSAGSVPKKAATATAESKDGGAGEKKADKGASPKEEAKKQPPEEKKPKEETVLLKIRLHCDGCADRIRRRIYKFKGVKHVVLDGNGKDEVKVTGTMDVPAMLAYLKEKINRTVEAVAPGKKKGGGDGKDDKKDKGGDGKDGKKDKGGDGDKNKAAGGDDKKDKGKGIDVAGPSTAAAAAFMAPAPAEASTYRVTPLYGYVASPQGSDPASYYPYPYYGNADGMGHANPSAATYYHQQQHPYADATQNQGYPSYPYLLDMPPPPQLFSDENPNACSVM